MVQINNKINKIILDI